MNPITVTGLGVWLADKADRHSAVDAWYQGLELPVLGEDEPTEAFRGASARALYDAGVRARSSFEWIGVGAPSDGASSDVDRWFGTIWEALVRARDVCLREPSRYVLITEIGEVGAGALLLGCQCPSDGPQYATIGGLACWERNQLTKDVTSGIRQAMTDANIDPESVAYLEYLGEDLCRTEDPAIKGLLDAYQAPEHPLHCALGTSSAELGGVLALVKVTLALSRRFLPALADWAGPDVPDRWAGTSFYVPTRSKPWFSHGSQRIAVVYGSSTTSEPYGGHLILGEPPRQLPADPAISRSEYVLIPLGAGSREAFEERLAGLERQVDDTESLVELRAVARKAYEAYRGDTDAPYVMALVGQGREGMTREIAYAREGLAKVFERGEVWQSPRGSTLTTNPLGEQGSVAFVYPGAFNAYLDLGRDLFHLFPFLYESFGRIVSDAGRSVQDRALYPRSLTPLSKSERRAREAALLGDPPGLIESGTSVAVLFTTILREAFDIHPDTALGYSLGEVSMLWAFGVWQDGERGLRAWRSSPLFKTQLSGPKKLIRERWNVPQHVDDGALWATYVLKAPVDRVRRMVEDRAQVEIMLVNAPGEVVIGGDPERCREVIEALDVHALPVPYDAVIHTSLMASLQPDFASLYHYPVRSQPDTAFYSAANYETLTLESDSLAQSLARMTCAPVDFIRLVDRVYEDGARIFVEVGPQRTCTRWIGKILDDRPHAAMAIDRKNAPDALSILGVLAGLVSHRVPVDLSLLYQETSTLGVSPPETMRSREMRVPTASPVSSAASTLHEVVGDLAHDHMLRNATIHRSFLDVRQTGMEDMSALIHTQMAAYGQLLGRPAKRRRVQFDEAAVQAFAQGAPTQCFGALFEPFEGRRVPRIPNGSFRFLVRVLHVDGPRGEVEVGRTLVGEYDVSRDAWFVMPDGTAPYAILMEMGMQPCGFLSAYMGSTRHHPDTDFYFRNLDGEGTVLRDVDLRGHTITSRASLRGSTAVGNAIVQTFAFSLACDGEDFYTGEATFGYFTRATLDARAGLDGGETVTPWIQEPSRKPDCTVTFSHDRIPARLSFLRDLQIVDRGGQFGAGYAHAWLEVSPDAWFFARHFYEDPVMPGSLGVEALRLALGGWLYNQIAPSRTVLPALRTPVGASTGWRYRGQILPDDLRAGTALRLDVHVIDWGSDKECVRARGQGSLWKGDLRIYEVKDLAVAFSLSEAELERMELWTMSQG